MTPAALLKALREFPASVAVEPEYLFIVTPRGRPLSADLRERLVAHKPALLALLRWDRQAAERLWRDVREKIAAARPADYPPIPSPDWERSEFAVEVALVCNDMLALIFAAQAHLHFTLRAFEDWRQLQHLMNREGR